MKYYTEYDVQCHLLLEIMQHYNYLLFIFFFTNKDPIDCLDGIECYHLYLVNDIKSIFKKI